MAVLQMAYAHLKDQARELDRLEILRGAEEATHEVDLDTNVGFIYFDPGDGPVADHAEIIQFLDYWNNAVG